MFCQFSVFNPEDVHSYVGFSKASIPHISKQMLINQLHELEEDKIIERTVYAEVPPRVEYKISQYGYSIFPILLSIQEWGLRDMQDKT